MIKIHPRRQTTMRNGPVTAMLFFLYRGNRKAVLFAALLMVAAIALADSWAAKGLPLGFLYLFPIIFVGSVLDRPQIGLVALACTFLTEWFDEYDWDLKTGTPRDILYFAAFFGVGLFVHEFVRSRQAAMEHLERIDAESRAKQAAEEQLEILLQSSPAAVFTADAEGRILLANDAAHRLFGLGPGGMAGENVATYLPSLASVDVQGRDRPSLRTVMECRGWRVDGEVFLANVWFSTYQTSAGPRMAAMVIDVSDNLRDQEEFSLQQVLASSRILVGAVFHEVRNICGAISVVHQNLARSGTLAKDQDFEALGTLIHTLERIASLDFRQSVTHVAATDLVPLLHELRIIIGPSLQEQEVQAIWEVQQDGLWVWADRQSLLQVFLNLVKNSVRAMATAPVRRLTITTGRAGEKVTVRITDTGCGIAKPERLFQPFQPDAENTGLGLYISRVFMRSFGGDLLYRPETEGTSFLVELAPAHAANDENAEGPDDKNPAG